MKEENREELITIGRTIAFDCLLNNWDHFFLIRWPRKEILVFGFSQSNLNNDRKR